MRPLSNRNAVAMHRGPKPSEETARLMSATTLTSDSHKSTAHGAFATKSRLNACAAKTPQSDLRESFSLTLYMT